MSGMSFCIPVSLPPVPNFSFLFPFPLSDSPKFHSHSLLTPISYYSHSLQLPFPSHIKLSIASHLLLLLCVGYYETNNQ